MVYSGNLLRRQQAYMQRPTTVGPVDPGHTHQQEGRGLFEPAAPPVDVPGEVWQGDPARAHASGVPQPGNAPYGHVGLRPRPVRAGVPEELADNTVTERMVAAHGALPTVPFTYPRSPSPGTGRSMPRWQGRAPAAPALEAFLVGPNGYDASNPPSELYAVAYGDPRFNLGAPENYFGHHEFWTKQGFDPELRGVLREYPALPADKPRPEGAAPWRVGDPGTARRNLFEWLTPSTWTTPSETALTDYMLARGDGQDDGADYGFAGSDAERL